MNSKHHIDSEAVFLSREDRFFNLLIQADRKKTTGRLTLTTSGRRFKAVVVLVDGMIVAAEVPWMCRDLTKALLPLFEGRYRVAFTRDVDSLGARAVRGTVDPLEVSLRSLHRYTSSKIVDDLLESVGHDTTLRYVEAVEAKRLKLNEKAEGLLLWIAHHPTTLKELTRQITCHERSVKRLVYFLVIIGALVPEPKKPFFDEDTHSPTLDISDAPGLCERDTDQTMATDGAQQNRIQASQSM